MPRFAFAIPFLPQRQDEWRALASQIPVRRATDHRMFLLDRGIFRERWWMQTGPGSPPLTLALWDCDDIERAVTGLPGSSRTPHGSWLTREVLGHIHGRSADGFEIPRAEVLSGTTTMATATAGTMTMFALPVPEEGLDAVRDLIGRIEHGDLAAGHGHFLTDCSIREEWIWLQPPTSHSPALLLIHWIGDDLDVAWSRLTHVGDDDYARVLREALFTRLVGLSPERVAGWSVEQLLVMHVRRSDSTGPQQRRLGMRLFAALLQGRMSDVESLLDDGVRASDDAGTYLGASDVAAWLAGLVPKDSAALHDLLSSDHRVLAILTGAEGPGVVLLLEAADGKVQSVQRVSRPQM